MTKDDLINRTFSVCVFLILIIGAGVIGYIQGRYDTLNEAIRLNHAKKVLVWDGTNTPAVSIQWITNQPISEKPALGNR